MLVVNSRITIPQDELQFTFSRSAGPGGQNVNKVNSKATLRWSFAASAALPADVRERFVRQQRRRLTEAGDILVTSQRYRDQGRNVEDCLNKLRDMVAAAAVVPKVRRPTKPSRGSKERRLREKKQTAAKKQIRSTREYD
jgi:ribosome-associated protein